MCLYKVFPGRIFSSIFQLKLKLFLQCLTDFLISFFFYLIFHHIFADSLYFCLFFSLPKYSPTFGFKLFCSVFLGATPYFGDIMLFIFSAAFLIKSFGFSLFFFFFSICFLLSKIVFYSRIFYSAAKAFPPQRFVGYISTSNFLFNFFFFFLD